MVTETAVLGALTVVKDPDLHQDIVALGFVKNLRIDGGRVAFTIELTTPACPVKEQMRDQAHAAVSALPGVTAVDVEMTASVRAVAAPDGGTRAGRRRQEHHRRRRRQGRRRQDDGGRQPRHRAGEVRQPRGHDRRRHLRPERAASCSASTSSSRPTARKSFPPRSTAFRSSRWAS